MSEPKATYSTDAEKHGVGSARPANESSETKPDGITDDLQRAPDLLEELEKLRGQIKWLVALRLMTTAEKRLFTEKLIALAGEVNDGERRARKDRDPEGE